MPPRTNTPREVTANEVDWSIDVAAFGFETTEELEPLDRIVGQPRALRALEFGLGVKHTDYNIYVAGASGMGKKSMIRTALEKQVARAPTPPDWVYVNNFAKPDQPLAVPLAPGEAVKLKKETRELVEQLKIDISKAFEHNDLRQKKEEVGQKYSERDQKLLKEMEDVATENEMKIEPTPTGFMMVPLKDGEALSQEEHDKLPEEEKMAVAERQQTVANQIRKTMGKRRELQGELRNEMREIDREVATEVIAPQVDAVAANYQSEKLHAWMEKLKEDMIDNWQAFRNQESDTTQQTTLSLLGITQPPSAPSFRTYEINVVVDNSGAEGAPVIIEHSPNYKNLFGVIERTVDRFGRETTDFSRVKAGSLMRANGGYLVLELLDALIEPVVWKELKRSIKRGSLQIEAYDPFGVFSVTALKPEPLPLDVKLVAMGDSLLYHLLQILDEDFREIFKVKAEFDPQMKQDDDSGRMVGGLIRKIATKENHLLPFKAEAVGEMLRAGVRLAADKERLTAEFGQLADLAREASYWAKSARAKAVSSKHVQQAVNERIYRCDLIASKIREWVRTGVLRIALRGTAIGQVNGLAVADLGDYVFGRPIRVSASIGVGAEGVINIERESKLSGSTYDKGVLILESYLRHKFASHHPLALSASLAMEQSYGMIDGDSATAAELLCLLGTLAKIPMRQDIAITGSVNQRGEVQAVGGVNEKIEGFFDVCREQGLTGEQGVVIPASNLRHTILRPDVVAAIRKGRFHIWTAEHVDQILELLTGRPAGDIDKEGSVHHTVAQRLQELGAILKQTSPTGMPSQGPAPSTSGEQPSPDPRPPGPKG